MDQKQHTPQTLDRRDHERIWQRVAPGLEPYPPAAAPLPAPGGEAALPGAVPDPCCMGSAAAEALDVLTGFAEEALGECRQFLAAARQGPAAARRTMRALAHSEASHARRLMAICYLITGGCRRPAAGQEPPHIGGWCAFLRTRYHSAACSGLNYLRAADATADPCLARLLRQLSEESYQQADTVLQLLENSLRG